MYAGIWNNGDACHVARNSLSYTTDFRRNGDTIYTCIYYILILSILHLHYIYRYLSTNLINNYKRKYIFLMLNENDK